MQGFQVTFFTHQGIRQGHHGLGEWLVEEARRLGVSGATLIAASEGFGRDGRIHAAHFIELADQPIEVVMALSPEECDRLFARLAEARIEVFYVKTPIEYGWLGR